MLHDPTSSFTIRPNELEFQNKANFVILIDKMGLSSFSNRVYWGTWSSIQNNSIGRKSTWLEKFNMTRKVHHGKSNNNDQ